MLFGYRKSLGFCFVLFCLLCCSFSMKQVNFSLEGSSLKGVSKNGDSYQGGWKILYNNEVKDFWDISRI